MREMSVRFSIILKQACCRMARSPLPAIREHQVTPRWLHIDCMCKKKQTHQHTTDKSHMMEGARCVFLTRIHSFISSRGGKGTDASTTTAKQVKAERSSERANGGGGGVAWKWEIETGKTKQKRKETWIKERGRSCRENWWNGDCLLLANGWPAGASVNGTCGKVLPRAFVSLLLPLPARLTLETITVVPLRERQTDQYEIGTVLIVWNSGCYTI